MAVRVPCSPLLDVSTLQSDKMKEAEDHLRAQRTVMNSKGTKRKVKEAENGRPAVFEWKKQRAR